MLAHFPVALLPTSLSCDIASVLLGPAPWARLAFVTLAGGILLGVFAAIVGCRDAIRVSTSGSAPLRVLTTHALLMSMSLLVFLCSLLTRSGSAEDPASALSIGLSATGLVLLFGGAWFGGELVYGHGVGVREPHPHE